MNEDFDLAHDLGLMMVIRHDNHGNEYIEYVPAKYEYVPMAKGDLEVEEGEENFIEERDKDGNLISHQKDSDPEAARRRAHENYKRQLLEDLRELEGLEGGGQFKDQNEEKEIEREDQEEPQWTEVRGSSSFYHICPICGSMIPGTGPKIDCADGVARYPKDLHEWWHKTVHCDWYQE